ncbi:MAG: alpha/beta hydrolase [Deltaproteobacteria bacterium]|jgi:pimeloyl-ACP methyl ester carboxylesterase|nr:alpha/beta hydrolase [Deltaproteobacteria bacterium]
MTDVRTETAAPIAEARMEGTVELGDGRSIGVAEYGDPDGDAIFWFHGTPGGRRQVPPLARELAAERGVRLIGVERPGVGSSTPHLHDRVADGARDIEHVADRLNIGRFGIVGLSGGGPYVLACAHELPERVVAGAVLGGVAPVCGEEAASGGAVALAGRFGPLLEMLYQPLGHFVWATVFALRPLASQAFDLFIGTMPEGDQEVMNRPEMKEMFIDDMLRAGRSQLHAPIYDAVLFARPWGFSLRDIRVPIRFWHGDSDHIVPLDHGEHQAKLVPDSDLKVRPREGHMGSLDAAEEILDTILGLWPGRETGRPDPA